MDLELTDDQELFVETTAKFLERTCPLPTVREWAEKEPAGYPGSWWRQGAELGWTSLLVPEDQGGGSVSGHGLLDLTLVAEETGRWVSPGPLVPSNLVAAALSEYGSEAQRSRYLPGILTGESIGTWCLGEPGQSGLPTGISTEAVRQGADFVLTGKKAAVEAGAEAEFFVVAALVDGRPTQFVVDADAPGVSVARAEGIDLVRRFATVSFEGVVLPPEAVLGEAGGAAEQIERLFEVAVALQCASMSGVIDRVLAFTLDYSFDRFSFGRPLASYQALKHRFADLKVWTEASLATAHAAARAVDNRSDKAFELVSVAKSYIGDKAPLILQDCVQLHGGIGVTWDHDLHLYIRRVVQDRSLFGTPHDHREHALRKLFTWSSHMGIENADEGTESVEEFRLHARSWLAATMPLLGGQTNSQLMAQDEMGIHARELQRILFEGGFAGLCFPKEYGGQGLSRAHQVAFTQESVPYEMPVLFNIPTFSILAPTLLDFGTEEQKLAHIPKIISGEELWVQFLSEPSGGSDLASLVTRATPDGDVFILNGSKIWSSGAFRSDYALCLARTEWHVPKHRGITCFIVKIHQPGIEVQQIKMVNGANEFCQEFFDDVAIPAENVLGEVNDGWTVATRLLYHERDAVGGGSPYTSGVSGGRGDHGTSRSELIELARVTGGASDPRVRQLVAEARVNDLVGMHLIGRVTKGINTGKYAGPAGAMFRLYAATSSERHCDIALEIAGAGAGVWEEGDMTGQKAIEFLMRQGGSLGGGSNEMQRNIISERVLGMPREYAADKDRPFDEVRHNASPSRPA